MNQEAGIMINNLEKIKEKFMNNTNQKKKEELNQKEIEDLKKLFL